jgi:hypothetical protein
MYVELNSEQPQDNSLGLLETMRSIKAELQSIKEDNEKLLKASKEQEELNEILLKNMTEMKQNKNVGQTSNNAKKEFSNDESHKHKNHPTFSDKIELLTEGSSEDSSENSTLQKTALKTKKIKWHDNKLFGEFKKIRPPSFDGESEGGSRGLASEHGKYFQIYNYPGNLRARLVMYQLNGKYSIWW